MPAQGIEWKEKQELLTFDEITRIARVFVNLGVDKIRITGGEPTVRRELETLIVQLSSLNGLKTLAMTTNAVLLREKALIFKEAGLQALNVSLDTLRKERFGQIAKREDLFEDVLVGIDTAIKVGFTPLKLNVVVMDKVNTDENLDFVRFVQDKPINVRFIEYMPFKDNQWSQAGFFAYQAMKALISEHYQLIPMQNKASDVAKDFYIEGFLGTVSFVTSMSDSFCGTCNRLRLTADGAIKSCLFYPAEVNIRDLLRQGISDIELEEIIHQVLLEKPEAHPPMEEILSEHNRSMIEIGG